jgi:hypothetical protein
MERLPRESAGGCVAASAGFCRRPPGTRPRRQSRRPDARQMLQHGGDARARGFCATQPPSYFKMPESAAVRRAARPESAAPAG